MEQIGFKNFRKFENFPVMDLAPITILVGGNNAGKSTLTKALMLVFDNLREMKLDLSMNGTMFASLTPKFQWGNTNNYNLHIGNYKRAHSRNAKSTDMEFEFAIDDYLFRIYINNGKDSEENSSPINKIVIRSESRQIEFTFDYVSAQMQFTIKDNNKRKGEIGEFSSVKESIAKLLSLLKEVQSKFLESPTDYDLALQELYEKGLVNLLNEVQKSLYAIKNGIANGKADRQVDKNLIGDLQKQLEQAHQSFQRLMEGRLKQDSSKKEPKKDNVASLLRVALINLQFEKDKSILAALKKSVYNKDGQKGTASIPFFIDFTVTEGSLAVTNLIMDMVKYAQMSPKVDEKTKTSFPDLQESIQLILSYSSDIKEVAAGIDRVLNNSVLEYIPAHAAAQQILFNPENRDDFMASVIDSYFERRIQKEDEEYQFILHWLKDFEIGDDFKIEPIDGFYRVNIINEESPVKGVPLADMGMGSIQLVILLLRLATIMNRYKGKTLKPTIIVEEPEMNLHPKAQSKLAELFYEINSNSKYRFQFIIETHSEYLVRKTQVLVKESNYNSEEDIKANCPFKVYYFPEDGVPYSMEYRTDGKFANEFGSGFFDEANNLIFDIL